MDFTWTDYGNGVLNLVLKLKSRFGRFSLSKNEEYFRPPVIFQNDSSSGPVNRLKLGILYQGDQIEFSHFQVDIPIWVLCGGYI